MDLIKFQVRKGFDAVKDGLSLLSPSNISKKVKELKQMPPAVIAMGTVKLLMMIIYYTLIYGVQFVRKFWEGLLNLMRGPPAEKVGPNFVENYF